MTQCRRILYGALKVAVDMPDSICIDANTSRNSEPEQLALGESPCLSAASILAYPCSIQMEGTPSPSICGDMSAKRLVLVVPRLTVVL